MARVFVGVGSNIEPVRHIRSGLVQLEQDFGPLTLSKVYRSQAIGFDSDDFLNLVLGFDTAVAVFDLVAQLHAIEDAHGRCRDGTELNARSLDLDLLLYDDLVIEQAGLCLPRKDITQYAFVLRPLAEIAPACCHPVLGISFLELWIRFDSSQQPLHDVELKLAPAALFT